MVIPFKKYFYFAILAVLTLFFGRVAFAATDDFTVSGGDVVALPTVGASAALNNIVLTENGGDDLVNNDVITVSINDAEYPHINWDQTVVVGDLTVIGTCDGNTPDIDALTYVDAYTLTLRLDLNADCANGETIDIDGLEILTAYASDTVGAEPLITVGDMQGSIFEYDNVTFGIGGEDGLASGLFFSSDGSKMYLLGDANNRVHEYELGTEWDITTAVYDDNFYSATNEDSSVRGIFFKPDGTKMYISGRTSDNVYQYTLDTPWDITSATYDTVAFPVAQDGEPEGVFFRADGAKMYIIGGVNDTVYQYSLGTPWDVSTAVYDAVSFDANFTTDDMLDIFFNVAGTRMYFVSSNGAQFHTFVLSTAWDVSTAGSGTKLFINAQDSSPQGLYINFTTGKGYIAGSGDDAVDQYSILHVLGTEVPTSTNSNDADGAAAGALTAGGVEPSSLVVGDSGAVTVSFTNPGAVSIAANDKIKITFPAGFNVSGAADGTCGTMDGNFATSVAAQVVSITRSAGSAQVAGVESCTLNGIVNPVSPGETGTYALSVTTSADAVRYAATVAADMIVGGSSHGSSGAGSGEGEEAEPSEEEEVLEEDEEILEEEMEEEEEVVVEEEAEPSEEEGVLAEDEEGENDDESEGEDVQEGAEDEAANEVEGDVEGEPVGDVSQPVSDPTPVQQRREQVQIYVPPVTPIGSLNEGDVSSGVGVSSGSGVASVPLKDSDNDGILDVVELRLGTNPLNSGDAPVDEDNSGIDDSWEEEHDIFEQGKDSDGDGIYDHLEYLYGTNPRSNDSDGDGISDAKELFDFGTDPLDANSPGSRGVANIGVRVTGFGNNQVVADLKPIIKGAALAFSTVEILIENSAGDVVYEGTEVVGENSVFLFRPVEDLAEGEYAVTVRQKGALAAIPLAYAATGETLTTQKIRVVRPDTVERPQPLQLGGRLLTDEDLLEDIRIEIRDNKPVLVGRTNFKYQVVATWQSLVLTSALIADSSAGEFSIEPPEALEPGEHEVYVQAIRAEDNAMSEAVKISFVVNEAQGNVFFPTIGGENEDGGRWLLGGFLSLLIVAAALAAIHKKRWGSNR